MPLDDARDPDHLRTLDHSSPDLSNQDLDLRPAKGVLSPSTQAGRHRGGQIALLRVRGVLIRRFPS